MQKKKKKKIGVPLNISMAEVDIFEEGIKKLV